MSAWAEPPKQQPKDDGLHHWDKQKPSEPLACTRCGVYYSSAFGVLPCPGDLLDIAGRT